MKFQIEVMTLVELTYNPAQYPAGMSPRDALALEIEELSKDSKEMMALDSEVVGVRGFVVREEHHPSPFADLAERVACRKVSAVS